MVVYMMVSPSPHHTVCPMLLSGLIPHWDRGTTRPAAGVPPGAGCHAPPGAPCPEQCASAVRAVGCRSAVVPCGVVGPRLRRWAPEHVLQDELASALDLRIAVGLQTGADIREEHAGGEELHTLLIASRCGILEVVHKRLGALERVIQHAAQRVCGFLRTGGLLCRRGSARWAAPLCLLRCRHRCPWRHRRDVS